MFKHIDDNSDSISINQKLRNKRNGQKQSSLRITSQFLTERKNKKRQGDMI